MCFQMHWGVVFKGKIAFNASIKKIKNFLMMLE